MAHDSGGPEYFPNKPWRASDDEVGRSPIDTRSNLARDENDGRVQRAEVAVGMAVTSMMCRECPNAELRATSAN